MHVATDVEQPIRKQIDRHEAKHTPYKKWCRHCNEGLAVRDANQNTSKAKREKYKARKLREADVPDTEGAKEGQTTPSIDYMTMGGKEDETNAPATMVMVNREDGGLFAYATTGKGIQGDRHWLAKRDVKDIDNRGVKDAKAQVRSNQEPSIVALQKESRELRRGKTVCTNSPVGESECNGRAEDAINRVQVKVRTSRSHIESEAKAKLDMRRPFATWLIRWAGEVTTKHSAGIDEKTSWQRRRGEACENPIVRVREKVVDLQFKTASTHADKGEPKMSEGIWCGINASNGGGFVGTREWVIKC